jgi:YVTN family beta-propeller protein
MQRISSVLFTLLAALLPGALAAAPQTPAPGPFVTFESGQVRPLALSPDGKRLFALNTPDGRLEIYDIRSGIPLFRRSVRVGLEPVAVAARSNSEVWVVNHLSDSVSIVDVNAQTPHVKRTLLVGDEPRDIVFAGPDRQRAFITAAHRGQNVPFDPQPLTPGVGRADVWVFDAANPGDGIGGTPLHILSLFGDTLRPLAVSPDGSRVYAGVFNSGNRTTVLEADIANGGLQKPGPLADIHGNPQPRTGLIVRFDGRNWIDNGDAASGQAPRAWTERVRFSLPDYDVFEIDAMASPPAELRRISRVGTTLFNMAVNPVNGTLYVSNTEARNHVRFEGEGLRSSSVRGNFVETRITVIAPGGAAVPRHLNRHIKSYGQALGSNSERKRSVATPLDMSVTPDGERVYIAAFGSGKVVWQSTADLERGAQLLSLDRQITVKGGGPSGLALDAPRNRLYVLTRFDNGISTIDTTTNTEIHHRRMFNPEPAVVVAGRRFLYDAQLSSSRGDSSCAGCHIFGDMDHLAWDLGNPDMARVGSPNTYNSVSPSFLAVPFFHPLKGPMSTQSLRGMRGHGPMHWRGDKTGVARSPGESIEEQSFEDFNGAFTDLLGRAAPLTEAQMDSFARFALELSYPPNPFRALDNSLNAEEQAGSDFYHDVVSDLIATCNGCHVLNPAAGLFGSNGTMSIEGPSIDEDFKIPHLRNMYQKIGRFGRSGNTRDAAPDMGPQIRGFGFAHDGASDTLLTFLRASVFQFPNEATRVNTARFMLAFPSELAPIVGQQLTVHPGNHSQAPVRARLELLRQRAQLTSPRAECELVASGRIDGTSFGGVLNSDGGFTLTGAVTLGFEALFDAAARPGNAVSYTCVPPGNGTRIGVDRNLDGVHDAV